jgi:hypothetical protein
VNCGRSLTLEEIDACFISNEAKLAHLDHSHGAGASHVVRKEGSVREDVVDKEA